MTTTLLHLEDEQTRLTLAPALGGSIVNWTAKNGGHPLLRPSDQAALDAGTPRRLACYPLAPWSNRIGSGGFQCPEGWLALAPNTVHDPYPIHGSAWQQPWQVLRHEAAHAILQLSSEVPFAYRAQLSFSLNEGALHIELSVTHLDSQAVWYGLGLHPYFPRNAHTQLFAPANAVWLGEPNELPSHEAVLPPDWDFNTLSTLPNTLVDHAFSGWTGACQIVQPDAGYALDCIASGADYYLTYCPLNQDFFCFEPVTHPINAHHLPDKPGLELLQYGASKRMAFTLQYRVLPR